MTIFSELCGAETADTIIFIAKVDQSVVEQKRQTIAQRLQDKDTLILLGILTLAAFLRLYSAGAAPLSLDEAFTFKFTEYPWSEFIPAVAAYDVHPPLYYAIAKVAGYLGDAPFFLRLPSILFGVFTIPLIYGIADNLFKTADNRLVGHFSALLFAVSTTQIGAAQNARGYTLFVFSMALAIYGCTWLLQNQDVFRSPANRWLQRRDVIGGLTATIAGFAALLWTHNLGLIYSAMLGGVCAGILLFQKTRNLQAFVALAGCGAAALLIWSPNLMGLIGQLGGVSRDLWVQKPGILQIADITASNFGIAGASPLPKIAAGALSIPVFLAGLIGVIQLWRRALHWQAIFLVLTIAISMIVLISISVTIKPILILRVTFPLFIPWIILVSYGAVHFLDGAASRVFQILVVALIAHGAIFYVLNQDKGEGWDRIVSAITETSGDDAIVFSLPNSSALPFDYQAERQGSSLRVHPIPIAFPATAPEYAYPSGAVGVPAINQSMLDAVEKIIEQTPEKDHWIILRGYWIYDKKLIVKPMLDKHFCYAPVALDSWYLLVFRLIPLSEAAPDECITIETRFFPTE